MKMLITKILKCIVIQTSLLKFTFYGTHNKPNDVRILSKHDHISFNPKPGHGICAIHHISCACIERKYMLEKLGPQVCHHINNHAINLSKILHVGLYQIILTTGTLFNCHIRQHLAKRLKNHQVVLDIISDNLATLVKTGQYVSITKTYATKKGYYVIKLLSEAYTPQEDTT